MGRIRGASTRRFGALFAAAFVVVGAAASEGGAPPAATTVSPPALDDVEHMCALLTGCDKLPLPSGLVPKDFVSCVKTMEAELASPGAVTFSLTLRECGLRASSCGALRSCALRGARAEVCAGRGKGGSSVDVCDSEGRAITCVDEKVAGVRDCPRGGEQCVVREGHALCALGSCAAEGPPSCSASGTRVLTCKKGKLVSLDCGAFGLRCAVAGDGPKCVTQGPACTEGSTRCEGNVSVVCHYGREVRVDCAAGGMTCASGANVGACVAESATPPCDPASPPRCDGATLRWCAWGKPRGYLCTSMGLSRCLTDDRGAHCGS